MAKNNADNAPSSPEERQTAITVASAKSVVAEIDVLQQQLTASDLTAAERRQAKLALADASDRLCNLMALAIYQLSTGVHGTFQEKLKAILEDLREQLLGMGTHVMLEKVEKIHRKAKAVLQGGAYPLGLAARLDAAFSAIIANMTTLGIYDRLDGDEKTMVEQTAEEIRALIGIETKLGILDEIDSNSVV